MSMPDWEEHYRAGDTPWDTGLPSSELVRVVAEARIAPCRALELGSGTGTNAVWLAQKDFDVTAADISQLANERARERAQNAGTRVHFILADVLQSPSLDGPFEFFFDRGCYHVVRRLGVSGYLETLRRELAPRARGLVLAGNAREPQDPGPPVVTADELRSELGQVFNIEQLREFRFDSIGKGGVAFLGWSCLVRKK
jgi:SAM-dependent methyltransferase